MKTIPQHYRVTPFAIKLSEEGQRGPEAWPKKVQIMRTCTFKHPKYGKVEITRKLFSDMLDTFQKKVRGIELMIDYSHDSNREAAGWIKDLEIIDNQELGESELWAIPEWTPQGGQTLSDKEFAYLSADFDPNYVDPETGINHGAVLLGAGLTNRPVIKKMNSAIQLSELYKENSMTEDEVKAAEGKLGQIDKLMQDLGVTSVEELMAKITEMKSQNGSLNEEKQLAEKTVKTSKLFAEGKITKAQVDASLKLSKESFDSFITLAEMNEGIKSTEQGNNGDQNAAKDKTSASDKVIALAEAMVTDKKVNIGDAISMVLSENKELSKAYAIEVGDEDSVEE